MKINVVQSQENIGQQYEFNFSITADKLDVIVEQFSIRGDIAINGYIVNTGNAFKINGNIYFEKYFQCDRCLEYFTQKQEVSFSETYKRADQSEFDSDDVICFSGDYIDISELVRETILLSQPLNNICSSDCRGLCLKCGANLNQKDCGCDRHIIDPRLAALQKLLNKN
ncbi:YceD family protein [Anaerosinus massiliensis]|uniref:YceD family protein n=1 Tax=Massilibacillus massiliensis TaxID=1806837 RepID=UPI0018FE6EFF|nr:DUF177 domain-containing protein [Massilibacillus massiliensis]